MQVSVDRVVQNQISGLRMCINHHLALEQCHDLIPLYLVILALIRINCAVHV